MTQCAWCPFDCPSPEVAPCAPEAPGGLIQASAQSPERPSRSGPRGARYSPVRRIVDAIRDLADYQEGTTS